MLGVQDKSLPQFIYTDQISYPNHVRLFVISVFGICLLDYALFGAFYTFESNIFTIWMSITLAILFGFSCICHFLLKRYSAVRYSHTTHLIFQLICFFTGLLIGANTVIINDYLGNDVPNLIGTHVLTLTALLLTASHIIALTFLTQHIRYFFLFFIPSITPLFISQLIQRDHEHNLFYLAYYSSFSQPYFVLRPPTRFISIWHWYLKKINS